MTVYEGINYQIAASFQAPRNFDIFSAGINVHIGSLDEEDRLNCFIQTIRYFNWFMRGYALNGWADRFLEIPNLFHTLANMSNVRNCMWLAADVEKIIKSVKKCVNYDREGELAYVVEEEFLKGMFKAIRQVHQELIAERKQRIWAIREELIATVLSPERVTRIAEAHGMEPMDWLIHNEGYEIEGY